MDAENSCTPPEVRHAEAGQRAREAVLAALRAGASYSKAAEAAGIGRATLYRWLDADEAFKAACDDAYDTGTDALEDEAHRRAVHGVRRVKFYKGAPIMVPSDPNNPESKLVVYTEHEYSDTLLDRQLSARRPEKYRTNHKVEHTGGVKITIAPDDNDL